MATVTKVKDKEMSEMFNQMLGTGDTVNLNIVYPKYLQMEEYSNNIINIIEKFANSPFFARYGDTYRQHVQMMLRFCNDSRIMLPDIYDAKIPKEHELFPDNADDEIKARIADSYKSAKTHNLTASLISLCNKLVIYRKYLQDESKLSHKFILNMPDMEFNPFPFDPTLNIKDILMNMENEREESKYSSKEDRARVENVTKQLFEFCMIVLHKLYSFTYNLYKVITSPDIDVDEFVNVIVGSIDQIKHQPQLSRCDLAFSKIKESVKMLKDNFSDYYKDFLESKNSTIIMENFIIDVSNKNAKSDPKLMQQFRKIISHYRSLAKDNIQNPQLRTLFDKVNQQFSQAERHADNIVGIEKGKVTEYIDPEDVAREQEAEAARKKPTQEDIEKSQYRDAQIKNADKSVDEVMRSMGLSDKKQKKQGKPPRKN
jgi:hypothetical protein